MKKIISFFIITTLAFSLFSQSMEVKSKIDWTKNEFISSISLNLEKAKIQLPSGKLVASNIIKTKTPMLMKDSILSLYVDSTNYLGDLVQTEDVTLGNTVNLKADTLYRIEYSSSGKIASTTWDYIGG